MLPRCFTVATGDHLHGILILGIFALSLHILVYGTNFKDFPELEHGIGYFWIICGVVIAVFVSDLHFASCI